jgi:hypothetical protein
VDLGLSGRAVESTLIEYSVVLQCSGEHFVVISSPFVLENNGLSYAITPEEDSDECFEPVRRLVGQTIKAATVEANGGLQMAFNNGTTLMVAPDDAYEAWNVSGPDGALTVCMPGGQLAIWTA